MTLQASCLHTAQAFPWAEVPASWESVTEHVSPEILTLCLRHCSPSPFFTAMQSQRKGQSPWGLTEFAVRQPECSVCCEDGSSSERKLLSGSSQREQAPMVIVPLVSPWLLHSNAAEISHYRLFFSKMLQGVESPGCRDSRNL